MLAPTTAIALPINVVRSGELYHGIADERSWVNVKSFATMEVNAYGYILGRTLHDEFVARGHTPKMAIWCIGMAGYYSKLPIFDMRGLSSRSVAHLPIAKRGRPGHEKVASAGLVVESNSDLSEIPVYPMPYARVTAVNVGGGHFNLVRYDPKLLAALPRGTAVQSFPAFIDAQVRGMGAKPAHILACDIWQMREYYFSRNSDESRRSSVAQAAAQSDTSLKGLESILLETRDLERLGYRVVRRFGFDSSEMPWQASGKAGQWLTDDLRAEQEYPFGRIGRYVNTFMLPEADGATGRMTSPEFVLKGDIVTFLIGGGQLPDEEHVQLIVDGEPVRTATGCDTEWLGQRIWNVAQFKGKSAHYVVEDNHTGSWGHLVVDEIIEWQAP
jgi:hypothetical protein